jgi:hypothetical protein
LVPGDGGRFEVSADGTLIFSKHALHRHAEPGEVVRLLGTQAAAQEKEHRIGF